MISIAPGSSPDRITRDTVSPAACRLEYAASTVLIHLRTRDEPKRDLQRDAEQPFGSDEQAGQVGSRLFEAVAAKRHERPVGQDGADAEHVVRGHAVTEAVRAARN